VKINALTVGAVETVKKQKQIARKILKEKFGKLFLFLPAVLFS